jgi:hypothetical protein
MARRAFRIIADRLINQTAFQKQFLSESFSQHLRLLNLWELHARFFGRLSNPSGFAGERFSEGKGRFSPIAFKAAPHFREAELAPLRSGTYNYLVHISIGRLLDRERNRAGSGGCR